MMQQKKLWKDRFQLIIKGYYEKKFLSSIKVFKRPRLFSIIILCIRYFYQLQLLISQEAINQLNDIESNFKKIENIQFLRDYSFSTIILYGFCGFNIIIISFFALFFILYITGVQENKLQKKITYAFSFVTQIYNYTLFIPSLYLSVSLFQESFVSYINIPLSLIISIIIAIHDQDYDILIEDYLARNSQILNKLLMIILEFIQVCIFSKVNDAKGPCIMSIIVGIFKVYYFSQYRNDLITHYNLFLSLAILLISIITTIAIFTQLKFSFIISLAVIITLSYQISCLVCSYYYSIDRLKSLKDMVDQPQIMNILVRQFLSKIRVEFENYRVNDYSLVLEQISVEHTLQCRQYPSCFCNNKVICIKLPFQICFQNSYIIFKMRICLFQQFFNSIKIYLLIKIKEESESITEGKLDLMSGKQRKRFLLDYLFKNLQESVNHMMKDKYNRNTDLIFCYLNYLIEIQQSKLLFYVELIRLEKDLNLSPFQMCFANQIYDKANKTFQNLYITQSRIYQNDNDRTSNIAYKEELQKNKQIQLSNLLEAISFDEQLNKAEKEFYKVIESKDEIMVILSKDQINLQELKNLCLSYYKQRDNILKTLQTLNRMNSKSFRLNYLLDCYIQIVGFGVSKYALFINENAESKIHFEDENQLKSQQRIDQKLQQQIQLFSKSVCIIFITLVDKPGSIKRLQNSFQSLFGYSAIEALNKDISLIIPKLIGEHHYHLLMDYFAQPNINLHHSQRSSLSSLIARDSNGWAVPISVYFKSDSIGVEDCGLTAYIERIKNDYMYLMLNETDFKVQIMSKELYDKIFSQFYHKSDIEKIYFIKIIPMLKYFEKLKSHSGYLKYQNSFDTIGFVPKVMQTSKALSKEQSLIENTSFENQLLWLSNININDFNIYRVRFKIVSVRNKYFEYHTIEFHQFRLVKTLQNIKESLKFLKYQFSNLLDIKISFDKQIQSIIQFQTNINISQNNYLDLQGLNEIQEEQINFRRERLQISQVDSLRYIDHGTMKNESQQNDDQQQQKARDYYQYNSQLDSVKFSPRPTNASETDIHVKSHFSKMDEQSQIKEFTYKQSQPQQSTLRKLEINNEDQQDFKLDSDANIQTVHFDLMSPEYSSRLISQNGNGKYFPSLKKDNSSFKNIITTNRQYNVEEGDEEYFKSLAPTTSQRAPLNKEQELSPIIEQKQKNLKQTNWFSVIKQKMREKRKSQQNFDGGFSTQVIGYGDEDESSINSPIKANNNFLQFNQFKKQANQNEEQDINNFIINMAKLQSTRKDLEDLNINGQHFDNNDDDDDEEGTKKQKSDENSSESSKSQQDNITNAAQNKQNSNQKELLQTKVQKMDKEVNKKRKREHQATADASSSRNNSSISKSAKKSVKRNIIEKKNNLLLRVLRIFGSLSLICIVMITLVTYFQMINNFSIAQETFKYIAWPLMFRCNYSLSSHYMAILQIIRRKIFLNPSFDVAYDLDIKNRVDFSVSDMNNLLLEFASGDQDKLSFFRRVTSQQVQMILNKDLASIKGSKLKYNAEDKNIVKMSMAYFLQQSVGYVYRFSTIPDNLYEQIVRLDNVPSLIANVTGIDQHIYEQCDSILTSLKNSALILMIVVILIVFIFVISIFPLYVHAQIKCENILKLFATIQQDHLDDMIKPINQTLLLAHKQQKIRLPEVLSHSLAVKKRKNISQTDSLQKFRPSFAFLSFLIFTSLIIQPITNYIQIIDFSEQAIDNIILVRTLYDLRAQSVSNTSQNYQYLLGQMDSTYLLYNPSYYIKRIPNLLIQNDQKLQAMIDVLNQTQGKKKFQQDKFTSFFNEVIYGDICSTMRDHPEYVKTENYVDYDSCNETRHGMLKKGFALSFKDFLSEFKELSGIYNITNHSEFKSKMIEWENRVDLRDFDDYFTILSRTMNSIKDFILQMIQDQLEYNQNVQTILLGYQYVVLAFVFYFGWINFQNTVQNEMYEVRQLLSILNIEVILENPYILSFLNK